MMQPSASKLGELEGRKSTRWSPSRTAASWRQNCPLGYRSVIIMSSSSNDSSPIRMTFLSTP